MASRGTTLSSYNPSLRDRIAWFISDHLGGGDRGWTNYINERVRGGVDFVPGVGDAVGFDDAWRSFQAGNYGQAAVEAGASALGTIPGLGDAAGMGLKTIFAGPMARGFNSSNAKGAMDAALFGASEDNIWKEFGTHHGPDLNPRFEIDDSQSSVSPAATQHGVYPLQGILTHPELYENYPDLADIPVISGNIPQSGLGSYFSPETGGERIEIDPINITNYFKDLNSEDAIRSTLLHEIQHAIQKREGFDGGFNPEMAMVAGSQIFNSFPRRLYEHARVARNIPERGTSGYDDRSKLFRQVAFETYLRNAGEVEARNVQARMNMDPELRRSISPAHTADRAPDEQLLAKEIIAAPFDEPSAFQSIDPNTLRGPVPVPGPVNEELLRRLGLTLNTPQRRTR